MAPDCVIGVDLGGTKLLAGAVDAELGVHHRASRPARGADRAQVLARLVDVVREAADAAPGPVTAVGFGIPSLMDREHGVAVFTNHLPLADVPLRTLLGEQLGLPVFLDNDANCAMLAEHRFGAARGARHAVLLTLGTGIGGGLVVDGRLVRGATGAAGEPGHMVVDLDGEPCFGNCPNRGCLETVVSGEALGRAASRAAAAHPASALGRAVASGRAASGALVTELAHDGDDVSVGLLRSAGEMLGVGIVNLVNLLNPEVVVIGGAVVAAGELLLEPAREVVAARALAPSRDDVRIVPARFAAESGMVGAAVLALDGAGLEAVGQP
jgi:glucokinase